MEEKTREKIPWKHASRVVEMCVAIAKRNMTFIASIWEVRLSHHIHPCRWTMKSILKFFIHRLDLLYINIHYTLTAYTSQHVSFHIIYLLFAIPPRFTPSVFSSVTSFSFYISTIFFLLYIDFNSRSFILCIVWSLWIAEIKWEKPAAIYNSHILCRSRCVSVCLSICLRVCLASFGGAKFSFRYTCWITLHQQQSQNEIDWIDATEGKQKKLGGARIADVTKEIINRWRRLPNK